MKHGGVILAGVLLGAAAVYAWRQHQAGQPLAPWWPEVDMSDAAGALETAANTVLDAVDDAAFFMVGYRIMSDARWLAAASKAENSGYVAALRDAEARIGAPAGLLVRQAWQESRFSPTAYNARSGASGIMQIVPRWHPGVDVWDPFVSISYAADYMKRLRARFGTWELALKAYNWGEGNLAKWLKGEASQPLETKLYSAQILADIGATAAVST